MRRMIVALIVGLALGYNWGYRDGDGGRGMIVTRALEKFGVSKVKNAEAAREQKVDEAGRP